MTNPWIREQDRRRNLVAALSTACLYVLAFTAAWVIGLIVPATLATVPGTVIIDLAGSGGPPGQVPLGLPNAPDRPQGGPAGAAPPPRAGSESGGLSGGAQAEAPATSASSIPAPSQAKGAKAAVSLQSKAAKSSPSAKASQASAAADARVAAEAAARAAADAQTAAAEQAAEATAMAAAGPAKTKKFGSSSGTGSGAAGAPVLGSGSGSSPGVEGGTGTATFRGSEMGNPFVTTFGASTGLVGRNLYVPIYRYMPLPAQIDPSVSKNIMAKETFKRYYDISGSPWTLKAQPPIADRDGYWNALEEAGFDASAADYKTSRKLSPVILEFAVGPSAKNKVDLVDVRLVSSSGSPDIDQAVIYGFNKTGFAVGGKFVYEF